MALTIQDEKIAKFLLEIHAVKFNVKEPFTWASGIKSPIYCDNRIINSNVIVRDAVINAFTDIINRNYLYQTNIIAAVATGGIPYGALVADRLKKPFIYVREERKKHGMMKKIEGEFSKGDKVLLIEDHISTGGSSMKAIEGIREEGMELVCLLSIMTYNFKKAENLFKNENVKHQSLSNLDTLLEVALQQGNISADDVKNILQFRESPAEWMDNFN